MFFPLNFLPFFVPPPSVLSSGTVPSEFLKRIDFAKRGFRSSRRDIEVGPEGLINPKTPFNGLEEEEVEEDDEEDVLIGPTIVDEVEGEKFEVRLRATLTMNGDEDEDEVLRAL